MSANTPDRPDAARPAPPPPEPADSPGEALRRESGRALDAMIRRLLALPMEQRTHFLRRRLPGGGSAL